MDADVGVLCSIGLDHVDWLGDSIEQIGREKAGIFRAGRPAVLGSAPMPESVWQAIDAIGARAVAPGRDYHVRVRGDSWDFESQPLTLRELPAPSLDGVHQIGNAAAALAAVVFGEFDLCMSHEVVARALRSVHIAGRFQRDPGRSGMDSRRRAQRACRRNLARQPAPIAACAADLGRLWDSW